MAVVLKLNVPGHVVFPITIGGAVLIIVVLGGSILFRDRMNRVTAGGVSCVLAAVVLLSFS